MRHPDDRTIGDDPTGVSPIRPATLSSTLTWLAREAGVPTRAVADAFRITPTYLRVLLHRDARQRSRPTPDNEPVPLGVRKTDPRLLDMGSRRERIERLRAHIRMVTERHRDRATFLVAAQALAELLPYRGYSASVEWLRVRSELHHWRAWFLTHSGHVHQALAEAILAAGYATRAHQSSTGAAAQSDRQRYADIALIASQAHLLRQAPDEARRWLKAYATRVEPRRRSSDYYRQLGVAAFQVHDDDDAAHYFAESAEAMVQQGEVSSDIALRYTSDRHLYLLQHDWDAARQLMTDAQTVSPLHRYVTRHWAIGTAVLHARGAVRDEGLALLDTSPEPPVDFGHQRTIRYLLTVTPRLRLDRHILRRWVPYLLYANAFQSR